MLDETYLLVRRIEAIEKRLDDIEAAKPAPTEDILEFHPIDLGLIPGVGPKHPFESFDYTERS
jgi:hypothetical protein